MRANRLPLCLLMLRAAVVCLPSAAFMASRAPLHHLAFASHNNKRAASRLRGASLVTAEMHRGIQTSRLSLGGGEPEPETITVSTFNIWCPLFRRIHQPEGETRECEFREEYMTRNRKIIKLLEELDSDVICLQEFWVSNIELVDLYKRHFCQRYTWSQLERTGERGDGLVTLVKDRISVRDRRDIIFRDLGDRVAMLLRLQVPIAAPEEGSTAEIVVVNTHLLFPHQPYFSIIRLRELRKILGFLELYRQQHRQDLPILIAGDFNGTPLEAHYNFMRQRNFTASCGPETEWVTHRNHLGEMLCVDYVWLQNPSERRGPIDEAWRDMVFRSTRQRVMAAGEQEMYEGGELVQAFKEAQSAEQYPLNGTAYRYALERLGFGLAAENLSDEDIGELMMGPDSQYVDQDRVLDWRDVFALFDLDRSGGICFEEFKRLCRALGVRADRARLQEAFAKIDSDNKGEIEADEFESWWTKNMLPAWQEHHMEKLRRAAQGRDGSEAKKARKQTTERDPSRMEFGDLIQDEMAGGGKRASAVASRRDEEEVGESKESMESEPQQGDKKSTKGYCELEMVRTGLHPERLEDGVWPDTFDLSDHSVVTCEFKMIPSNNKKDVRNENATPSNWVEGRLF
eukprot:CAMPEP_0173423418 /NCGR_PEP_ID=MMETSP1357-20121228/3729_1 /TAXON_ID=77926 /ORGANISM="Hemiselmis rufescens, Strain PCC563" /LENGTH=627 /DNA_ID=CAMNT_0014386531 /DNA_START=23 /DNA_END=1906 /DNA_ORIENTATION=+